MNNQSVIGKCESCQFYQRLRRVGFCQNCIRVLLTDGTYHRSGYVPKTPMTITAMPEGDSK